MTLNTDLYINQAKNWPDQGRHIMAQFDHESIIVYQAYRPEIGNYAINNQKFDDPFSLNRMTWIKPNFLWMMYRSGWAQKEGQTIILAMRLRLNAFVHYLKHSVYSSFQPDIYDNKDQWNDLLRKSSVRLQWDPDHDPYGAKLHRRAVQIGLRNEFIQSYASDDIVEIEDISSFVREQYNHVKNQNLSSLLVPHERPLIFDDHSLNDFLKLDINGK